jgi:hypothetical protein
MTAPDLDALIERLHKPKLEVFTVGIHGTLPVLTEIALLGEAAAALAQLRDENALAASTFTYQKEKIESLQAEVARLDKLNNSLVLRCDDLMLAKVNAEAERDAFKADAERYRELRDGWMRQHGPFCVATIEKGWIGTAQDVDKLVDAAIDAARAAWEGK